MRKGKPFILTAMVCAMALMLALPTGCGTSTKEPVVTTVSPSDGTPGTEVTVTGEGFGKTRGNSTIQFRTTQATVTATVDGWSDTEIKTEVPSMLVSGQYKVVIVTDVGTSQGADFEVKGQE